MLIAAVPQTPDTPGSPPSDNCPVSDDPERPVHRTFRPEPSSDVWADGGKVKIFSPEPGSMAYFPTHTSVLAHVRGYGTLDEIDFQVTTRNPLTNEVTVVDAVVKRHCYKDGQSANRGWIRVEVPTWDWTTPDDQRPPYIAIEIAKLTPGGDIQGDAGDHTIVHDSTFGTSSTTTNGAIVLRIDERGFGSAAPRIENALRDQIESANVPRTKSVSLGTINVDIDPVAGTAVNPARLDLDVVLSNLRLRFGNCTRVLGRVDITGSLEFNGASQNFVPRSIDTDVSGGNGCPLLTVGLFFQDFGFQTWEDVLSDEVDVLVDNLADDVNNALRMWAGVGDESTALSKRLGLGEDITLSIAPGGLATDNNGLTAIIDAEVPADLITRKVPVSDRAQDLAARRTTARGLPFHGALYVHPDILNQAIVSAVRNDKLNLESESLAALAPLIEAEFFETQSQKNEYPDDGWTAEISLVAPPMVAEARNDVRCDNDGKCRDEFGTAHFPAIEVDIFNRLHPDPGVAANSLVTLGVRYADMELLTDFTTSGFGVAEIGDVAGDSPVFVLKRSGRIQPLDPNLGILPLVPGLFAGELGKKLNDVLNLPAVDLLGMEPLVTEAFNTYLTPTPSALVETESDYIALEFDLISAIPVNLGRTRPLNQTFDPPYATGDIRVSLANVGGPFVESSVADRTWVHSRPQGPVYDRQDGGQNFTYGMYLYCGGNSSTDRVRLDMRGTRTFSPAFMLPIELPWRASGTIDVTVSSWEFDWPRPGRPGHPEPGEDPNDCSSQ